MSTQKQNQTRRAINEIKNRDIYAPWHVSRFTNCKHIRIYGDQASLSESGDFGTVTEIRTALDWLVDQFGGKVTWSKNE